MLLALAAIWTGVDLAGEPYRAAMEFWHAGACPSGAGARGSGCMGHESGPVVDKSILVGTDSDTDCYLSVERTSNAQDLWISPGRHAEGVPSRLIL
jgi:hypothetical protein